MSIETRIDKILLSVVSARWTKGAVVAALAMRDLDDAGDEDIRARLQHLAKSGSIELVGDARNLRTFEVRKRPGE